MRRAARVGVLGALLGCAAAWPAAPAKSTATTATTAPVRGWQAEVEIAARHVLEAKAEQAGWLEPRFELTVLESQANRQGSEPPACKQPLRVEPVETRHVTRMRFAAHCDDEAGWQRDAVVRAKVMARVVVMAADVPAGRAIQDADLALEVREVSTAPDAVSDTLAVVGLTSRRSLQMGQLVSSRVLLTPVLVQRGQPVTIDARNGDIAVSVAGEALDNGRLREVIRVRNVTSGKVIRARVVDVGKVEPETMVASPPAQSRD